MGRGERDHPLARVAVFRLHRIPIRTRDRWRKQGPGLLVGFEHIANSVNGVRSSRTPCASRTPFAGKTMSGRLLTGMPTTSRPIRRRSAGFEPSSASLLTFWIEVAESDPGFA